MSLRRVQIPESDYRIRLECGETVGEFEQSAECSIRIQNAKACGGGWEQSAECSTRIQNTRVGSGMLRGDKAEFPERDQSTQTRAEYPY